MDLPNVEILWKNQITNNSIVQIYFFSFDVLQSYLRSLGSSDCAASLSMMYCKGWWSGCVSSCKADLPMDNNSPAMPASHITCWFLSDRTRLLMISATYNCNASAICGLDTSDMDGSKWSIPTTMPGCTTIGSGAGGLRFKEFIIHLLPLPGESNDFCC